jgi:hypothetical protein
MHYTGYGTRLEVSMPLARCNRLLLIPAFLAVLFFMAPTLSASATTPSVTGKNADLATVVTPVQGYAPANPPRRPFSIATFQVAVTNNGPNVAWKVTVTNTVGNATLAGIGTFTVASLKPQQSLVFTVTVHYREFLHNQFFDDSATASSTTHDPNTGNNTAMGTYSII